MSVAPPTRRQVLAVAGGAAAALAVGEGPAAASRHWLHGPLDRRSWLPLVGEHFRVTGGPRLRLVSVEDLLAARRLGIQGHVRAFGLHFVGPATAHPVAGSHELRHGRLTAIRTVLSAGAPGPAGQSYHVTINRLRPSQLTL